MTGDKAALDSLDASLRPSSRIYRVRLDSIGHGEVELNLVGSDSDEVFMELEHYDGSKNCML